DVSQLSIEQCSKNPALRGQNIRFMTEDIRALAEMPALHHRFDLLISYSVLHLVTGTTHEKFEIIKKLTRPGALLAIDAAPRVAWNLALFSFIRFLLRVGIGGMAIRLLGPLVARNMPKDYIEDLSKINYMKTLNLGSF